MTSLKKITKKHKKDKSQIVLSNVVKIQTLEGHELIFHIYLENRIPPKASYQMLINFLESHFKDTSFEIFTRDGIQINEHNWYNIIDNLVYNGTIPEWNIVLHRLHTLSISIKDKIIQLTVTDNNTLEDIESYVYFNYIQSQYNLKKEISHFSIKDSDEIVNHQNFLNILDTNQLEWNTHLVDSSHNDDNTCSLCGTRDVWKDGLCYQCYS